MLTSWCLWSSFKATVTYCMTHFVPLKTKRPQKHNPSITCEVIHAKRKVKRLRHVIKMKRNNAIGACNLAFAIADFKQKSKRAIKQYFTVVLPRYIKNNPHWFWKQFRPCRETKSSLTDSEKINQANMFNNYFQSVFTDNDSVTPPVHPVSVKPIESLVISDSEILNLLPSLDPKKACGHDDIANDFLLRYAEWRSKYLGTIPRGRWTLRECAVSRNFSNIP